MSSLATSGVRAEAARPGVWLAEVALLLMSLIWGVNYSVIKYGTGVVPPLAYNGARISLAAVALIVIALVWGGSPPARRDVFALLALGALGNGIYQIFFIEGLARTRAGEAALVVGASPALMAIFGRMRGVERVSRRGAAGIALSMFGVALIVLGRAASGPGAAQGGGSLAGDLLVLCGAACWAIYTVLLMPYTQRISGWWVTALTILGGTIVLAVAGARDLVAMQWSSLPVTAWAAILYSGLGALVVAYFFWYYGVKRIGPTRTALYGNTQPLIALIVAWLTLSEVPTAWQLLGAATIVSGVLLTRVPASEAS
ncbi:MAG TPA: DMT family transporter [Gemmatimonadaceae bacterium]|nr:DMT family transporter [Gemmatimonadaceae bacterium]